MNVAFSQALVSPEKITSENKTFFENKEMRRSDIEKQDSASDFIHFAPLIGAALAHNGVHSLFAQRSIQYFAHPITNYFMNLPIAALAGSVAFAAAKAGLASEDTKKVPSDFESIGKAISWSTCFNMLAAIGMHEVIMNKPSDPFTHAFFALVGPLVAETSIAIGSIALSLVTTNLACDMFSEAR